jgi:hypothetical protein
MQRKVSLFQRLRDRNQIVFDDHVVTASFRITNRQGSDYCGRYFASYESSFVIAAASFAAWRKAIDSERAK